MTMEALYEGCCCLRPGWQGAGIEIEELTGLIGWRTRDGRVNRIDWAEIEALTASPRAEDIGAFPLQRICTTPELPVLC
jgi:hypothetical protein